MVDWLRRKIRRILRREARSQVRSAERRVERKVRDTARKKIKKAIDYKDAKKISGKMIKNFKKFKESWEKDADDPIQSVFHFLIGAYNYKKDPAVGSPMISLVLSKKHQVKDSNSPTGRRPGPTDSNLIRHMCESPHTVISYLGGTYEKDYKDFNAKKPVMHFLAKEKEDKKGKYVSVIIQSGGKDLPTPVGLAKNKDGQWKIREFSSIATDCRKPKSVEEDF